MYSAAGNLARSAIDSENFAKLYLSTSLRRDVCASDGLGRGKNAESLTSSRKSELGRLD